MSDLYFNPNYKQIEIIFATNMAPGLVQTTQLLYTASHRAILTGVNIVVANGGALTAGVYGYLQIASPTTAFSRQFYVQQLVGTTTGLWSVGQWNPQLLVDRAGTIILVYANASAATVGLQASLSLIGYV